MNTPTVREQFEAWIKAPPFERQCMRWPSDDLKAWPGNYREYEVELAWCAWKAAADQIDTRRLRHHLVELGKLADRAALVLATIEPESSDEAEQIQQIINGISTWAPPAMLATVTGSGAEKWRCVSSVGMDIEALAKKAGMIADLRSGAASCVWTEGLTAVSADQLNEFARLVAAEEREACALKWRVRRQRRQKRTSMSDKTEELLRETGMSMRDYFAAEALKCFCTVQMMNFYHLEETGTNAFDEMVSTRAYEIADAMLTKRANVERNRPERNEGPRWRKC